MSTILDEVMPVLTPHLVFDEKFSWIKEDLYLLPSLLAIRNRQRETRTQFEVVLRELEAGKPSMRRSGLRYRPNGTGCSQGRAMNSKRP